LHGQCFFVFFAAENRENSPAEIPMQKISAPIKQSPPYAKQRMKLTHTHKAGFESFVAENRRLTLHFS